MIRLTLRVPDEVYQQIQERARLSRRSLNSQIIHDLEMINALQEREEQEGTIYWLKGSKPSEYMNLLPK